MGACLSLCDDYDHGNDCNLKNTTHNKMEEEDLIEVKIDDNNHQCDPWKYSELLSINDVTEMLKDITFEDCEPFTAPIKYGKVVKVYDGDTIHVIAPIFDGVMSRFRVRLNGIDTPELRTKDEWEKKAGNIVKNILIEKIGDQIIELRDVSYDKYGRILANIIFNDENINQWLIEIGWAFPYEGKGEKLVKKTNWKSKVLQYDSEHIKHEA